MHRHCLHRHGWYGWYMHVLHGHCHVLHLLGGPRRLGCCHHQSCTCRPEISRRHELGGGFKHLQMYSELKQVGSISPKFQREKLSSKDTRKRKLSSFNLRSLGTSTMHYEGKSLKKIPYICNLYCLIPPKIGDLMIPGISRSFWGCWGLQVFGFLFGELMPEWGILPWRNCCVIWRMPCQCQD